jgi:CheY-like chemotaxis protein
MAKRPKILLVEDKRITRVAIKAILSGLGYVLKEVDSGEKALKTLARTSYDAIILDIRLPGINGIDMLKAAKELRISLPPVIVLTDRSNVKNAFEAGKLEAFRFVPKGRLEPESFKEIIVAAIGRGGEAGRVVVKHCFKHNQSGCSTSFKINRNLIFVGIPFTMKKVYEEGIKAAVRSVKMECWRANELHRTGDYSCKICGIIQACQLTIFDISKLSPNVLLEMGFAFALGKDVIILKQRRVKMPSNLKGFEPVVYTSVTGLRTELVKYLRTYVDEKRK